jgi:hypothetical protein
MLSKVVVLKLVHRISGEIKLNKRTDQARAASLANYLVLLKLP